MGLSHMGDMDMDIIHFTPSAFRTLDGFISDGIYAFSPQQEEVVQYTRF